MNNPDMINLYIEKLVGELTELIKTKILLQTQLEFLQKSYNILQVDLDSSKAHALDLKEQLDGAVEAKTLTTRVRKKELPENTADSF